jgi:hypothetical protein
MRPEARMASFSFWSRGLPDRDKYREEVRGGVKAGVDEDKRGEGKGTRKAGNELRVGVVEYEAGAEM